MRQGQNKRMRGRNNNGGSNNANRKGPNPLTRSYESNGPDVKIRGTAHHVAEKYLQLARDAQTGGDPVMAESYLQHAEHYFRLIASAQLAQQQSQPGYQRPSNEPETDEDEDDDDGSALPDRFASPQPAQPVVNQNQFVTPVAPPYQDRPQFNGEARSDNRGDQQQPRQDNRGERGENRNPRPDRGFQDRNFQERNAPERGFQDRNFPNRYDRERNNQNRNQPDRNTPAEAQSGEQPGPERNGGERPQGQDRYNQTRNQRDQQRRPRFEMARPEGQGSDSARPEGQRQDNQRNEGQRFQTPRAEPRSAPVDEAPVLPAFITAPVRVTQELPSFVTEPVVHSSAGDDEADGAVRTRRRRRTKAEMAADAAKAEAGE